MNSKALGLIAKGLFVAWCDSLPVNTTFFYSHLAGRPNSFYFQQGEIAEA
jgi:hypothetical protein